MRIGTFRQWGILVLFGALVSMTIACLHRQSPLEPLIDPCDAEGSEIMLIRSEVKRRLATEVAAGQRSFLEAAALFEALDRLAAPPLPLTSKETDVSTSERACQNVIHWVATYLDDSDGLAILICLHSEMQAAREESRGLRLPESNIVETIERLLTDARNHLPKLKEGIR